MCPPQLFLAWGLAIFVSVASATETTDLGQNLSYLRVHELADVAKAVTSVVPENRALVLDLRYATARDDSAAQLAAALAARTGPAPLLILVAPGTPAPLAAALARLPPGAVTIGVKESSPAPRLVVAQPAETDRRAHAALDSGLPLAALINGKVEKERYDEASLVQDFSNGSRNPRPPRRPAPGRRDNSGSGSPPASPGEAAPIPATTAAEATPEAHDDTAPVLTDRVLQRAVHLHRALFAIRPR